MFPKAFLEQIHRKFGNEAEAFLAAMRMPAATSIRLNPRKASAAFEQSELISWHPHGRFLDSRPVFALDPLWHGGAYYVQEASSMLVREVIRQSCVQHLNKPIHAIDLCAAPGGKTTILLDELHPNSLIVANEVIQSRVGALTENLERWGHANMAITSAEVERFSPLNGLFDLVLVDAPCSGEGLFRKDQDAATEWSPAHVQLCTERQQRILAGAVPLLSSGGVLLYSTCTFNDEENDHQISWLIKTYGLEPIQINLPDEWGFRPTKHGYAALPHKVIGEGFYIAALRNQSKAENTKPKTSGFKRLQKADKQQIALARAWVADAEHSLFQTKSGMLRNLAAVSETAILLENHLPFCLLGREIGEIKGKDLIPTHALALSLNVATTKTCDLSLEQALSYLRRQDLQIDLPLGWTLMLYAGIALGWVKVLPNRVNNYLPMERRLRIS